jgi:hypothetical protein
MKVMKNIHVLPTENSSRLSYNKDGVLELHRLQWRKNTQNIYITSDEEIKEGEWCTDGIYIIQATPKLVNGQGLFDRRDWRKIILTTDQDLIKDGVQAIDDEFLEWFVKNPSCEFVEVDESKYFDGSHGEYIIIIPQEEPKQETLEEAAESWLKSKTLLKTSQAPGLLIGFTEGAKWQQERMYSEEEVLELLLKSKIETSNLYYEDIKEWFEQFKKK